jgi:FkbM family methyltransferase
MIEPVQVDPVSHLAPDMEEVRRLNWFGMKPLLARLIGAPVVNPIARRLAGIVLPRRIAKRIPVNKASVTYRLYDGSSIMLLEPLHDAIARDIWQGRGKPTEHAERLKVQIFEELAKSARTCLDIGAYSGFFALVAARANPALHAITFEIVPENHLLIMRNVIANDLVGRIEPRLRGLAVWAGSMTVPQTFGGVSHLSSISLGSIFKDGVTIPLSRLDDEVGNVSAPVLVKIDVEGFESDVFLGGETFFHRYRPDVVCEILPGADESCKLISNMLMPLGYHFYRFGDDGLQHSSLQTQPVMRDWLFTAKPEFGPASRNKTRRSRP